VEAALDQNGARAVIGTDGAVWTANEAFCSLVRLDEPALRHLGWRQLVHAADRRYVAAHLVEVLAGDAGLREFEVRLVPPDGRDDVQTRLRVELVRDSDGRQGWFLVEAWRTP
jgi:PAS domain-containing protein